MMCISSKTHSDAQRFIAMKHSRKSLERKAHTVPDIIFEQQQLTSFDGLLLLQPFLAWFEFKVIITNKRVGAGTILRFHEGRGAQEGTFGELKTHCTMGHVPVRRCLGNQMYLPAGLFANRSQVENQNRIINGQDHSFYS